MDSSSTGGCVKDKVLSPQGLFVRKARTRKLKRRLNMAFPTTIYDSAQRAKETYAAQNNIPLGTRLVVPDGRVFHYAQAGATALNPFKLVKAAAVGPWSTMSASGAQFQVQRVTSYVAGATQIKWSYGATGAAVADYFKDGYLVVQSTDTAEAQMARLGSHAALASATLLNSNNIINIPEGLDLDLNTETDCWPRLIPNPYKYLVICGDLESDVGGNLLMGVPIVYVAAKYYFWCQTWGPCLVLQDAGSRGLAAEVPGWLMYFATGSTGGVCMADSNATCPFDTDSGIALNLGPVGNLMQMAQLDTGYALVSLTLAP
jgi:hypothetical protein